MKERTRSAELRFSFPGQAERYRELLAVEASEFYRKVRVQVEDQGDQLVVAIEADDTASLRAAMSSVLNWLGLIQEVETDCGDEGGGRGGADA